MQFPISHHTHKLDSDAQAEEHNFSGNVSSGTKVGYKAKLAVPTATIRCLAYAGFAAALRYRGRGPWAEVYEVLQEALCEPGLSAVWRQVAHVEVC